jgi:hypothetical protein
MDINAILFELHSELRRVDRAILALHELAPFGIGHGAGSLNLAAGASRNAQETESQQRLVDFASGPLPRPS